MSIHNDPLSGPGSIQQTQNTSAADVRAHAKKFGEAIHDIIERSEHLTLEPLGLQQAPLPFLSVLPPAELDTDSSTMPAAEGSLPSDTASALSSFYGQNSSAFSHILGIKSPVVKAMEDFPSSSPPFQSAVSALEVAILVDSINAQQAQAGARLGMISSRTAVATEQIQQTSAASQYASGMSQATQSEKQAQSEIISGAISIGVGCVTAILSVASMGQLAKAASLESDVKAAATDAELTAGKESAGAATTATDTAGRAAGTAGRVAGAADEVSQDAGEVGADATKAVKQDAIGKIKAANAGKEAGASGDAPPSASGEAPASESGAKPTTDDDATTGGKGKASSKEPSKLKSPEAAAAKTIGDRLKLAADFMNAAGTGAATVASGEIKKATYTDQAAAAAEQQAASMQTAQAQYTNQFMDSSSTAAKTSMDNAAQTAQASQSIKQAASQSASSIFRG